jgi:hypothetical protein
MTGCCPCEEDGCESKLTCPECAGCGVFIDAENMEMSGITKDTFQSMSVEAKLDVLFDYLVDIQEMAPKRVRDRDIKCAKQIAECKQKFEHFDNECDNVKKSMKIRMYLNTSAALIGVSRL